MNAVIVFKVSQSLCALECTCSHHLNLVRGKKAQRDTNTSYAVARSVLMTVIRSLIKYKPGVIVTTLGVARVLEVQLKVTKLKVVLPLVTLNIWFGQLKLTSLTLLAWCIGAERCSLILESVSGNWD